MDQPVKPADFARVVRIMHGAMVAGLALVGATFFLLLRVGQSPALGSTPSLGVALAGVGVGLLAVAVTVLRRRVPERPLDQSPDAYWATVERRGAAIVLWAVVEGAGLLASIGYVLTGAVAPAVVVVLAIALLIVFRPSGLEGEGAA